MDNVIPIRPKLVADNDTGMVSSVPPQTREFGERLLRIRTSLEKINQLMAELKKGPRNGEEDV